MDYKTMREIIPMGKTTHQNEITQFYIYGDFAVAKTSSGEWFIVDRNIVESIRHRKWNVDTGGYVKTDVTINGVRDSVRLHDYVLSYYYENKPSKSHVDHINGCKTDNRKCNLRIVTPSFNLRNVRMRSNNTSGINGVAKAKNGKWRAYITINQKQISLGTYKTKDEAITARFCAEEKLGFCHTFDMERYISSKFGNGISDAIEIETKEKCELK